MSSKNTSSTSKPSLWKKLRTKLRNMLPTHHRAPPPPQLGPTSSPPQQPPIIFPERMINLNRTGSARIARSCLSSSTRNCIHPLKHGKSFSMETFNLPPTFSLPEPDSLCLINFSDLVTEKKPIRIEAGGMVYKSVHRLTGRVYAVKVIKGYVTDSMWRQTFREYQTLRQVANPNLVKCYDICMVDQHEEIHVLLEFINGGTLKGKQVHDERSLANLARQILAGLAHLHRRNVAHRNIKPGNILINSTCNEVKIGDFVGRVFATTMDPCHSCVGNIAYMCPERINIDLNHGREFDACAGDVWSFGMSMLEVYLGRYPFNVDRYKEGSWSQLVVAICIGEPPEAPVTASIELRDFIGCCLQKEPQNRMSAEQLLKHPFVSGNRGGSLRFFD